MKILILGSGKRTFEYPNNAQIITVDYDVTSQPGIVCDLNNYPWPFENNTFDMIHASHILEHLNSIPETMKEIHRILKSNGTIEIDVPYAHSTAAFIDPTHVHYFLPESFTEYFGEKGNMNRMANNNLFKTLLIHYKKNTKLTFLPIRILKLIFNGVTEFKIIMQVVKNDNN